MKLKICMDYIHAWNIKAWSLGAEYGAGMWCQIFRNLDHCNQETTGSIEKYHGTLKVKFNCKVFTLASGQNLSGMPSQHRLSRSWACLAINKSLTSQNIDEFSTHICRWDRSHLQGRFLTGKQRLRGRRLDWLVHHTLTHVANDYLHMLHKKSVGAIYSSKMEAQITKSALNAMTIPEANITLPNAEDEMASIQNANHETYHIAEPGTANANCTCNWYIRGNTCKHVMKVILYVECRCHEAFFVMMPFPES